MEKIPPHCIEIFKERFKTFPSLINIILDKPEEVINNFFKKSHLVWFNTQINDDGKKIEKEKFFEYDSSGIMVYIKGGNQIFILTTIDRLNVAEFTILNLKRIK